MQGNVTASMQAPFFYTSPNTAQVHLAVEIPSAALKFEKVKGKQHAAINILGIAYKPDASIAARFSDTVNRRLRWQERSRGIPETAVSLRKPVWRRLRRVQTESRVQFRQRELRQTRNAALDRPLPWSGIQHEWRGAEQRHSPCRRHLTDLDSQLLEDRTPLVVQGMQISPSASNHFKKTDTAAIYAEVYEPLLKNPNPPEVAYELIVVERKSGQEKAPHRRPAPKGKAGDPVIPLGLKLPVASLDPGSYRVKLRAVDSVGNSSKTRIADFEVE